MGETVLQLAEKVMRNVAAYRQMAGPLVGWWYGVKAKLTAATTAEEVMAGWCIRRLAGDRSDSSAIVQVCPQPLCGRCACSPLPQLLLRTTGAAR